MSLVETLTLLTATTSALVTIIHAVKGRSTADKVDTTLNAVQSLVSGQSEVLTAALLVSQERNRALEAELSRHTGQP